MEPSTKQTLVFPALDSLRFVGSMAIVLTHVSFQTGVYGPGLIGTVAARLDVGVALFFALSGFLLARPYFSHMSRQIDLPKPAYYFWKRALRIVPVYVLTVVGVLLLIPEARGSFIGQWIPNLTMTTIYSHATLPAGLTQMWSLATEVMFYLILPALMAAVAWSLRLGGRWHPTAISVLLIVMVCCNVGWLSLVDLTSNRPLWLPAFLSWFSVGMAVAVVSVDADRPDAKRWTQFIARLGSAPNSCMVAALSLFLIASTPLAGPIFGAAPTHGEAITKNILYALVAFFCVIPGVFTTAPSRLIALMSIPSLRYLGRISYGIFCIHLLVLYFVFDILSFKYFDGHFLEVLVVTVLVTVAGSAVIYRIVERPINNLKRFGRPKTEPAISPNAQAIAS